MLSRGAECRDVPHWVSTVVEHNPLGLQCCAAAGTSFQWGSRPAAAALVLSTHKWNFLPHEKYRCHLNCFDAKQRCYSYCAVSDLVGFIFPLWLTGSQCKPCCGLSGVPQNQMFFSQDLLFPDAAKHCALPSSKAAFLLCSLLAFAGKKFFSFRLK